MNFSCSCSSHPICFCTLQQVHLQLSLRSRCPCRSCRPSLLVLVAGTNSRIQQPKKIFVFSKIQINTLNLANSCNFDYLCRLHDIPDTIRTYDNEFILPSQLNMLDLWFTDKTNFLSLKITQCSCHSNTRTFIICPDSVRSNRDTIMHKFLDFTARSQN